MKWESAAGQKGNVIYLRQLPIFSAGLLSQLEGLKEKKTTKKFFLQCNFKIPIFLFYPNVWQVKR